MDPDRLMKTFCEDSPRRFRGFPVGFGQADEHGISSMEDTESAFRPMINISTLTRSACFTGLLFRSINCLR